MLAATTLAVRMSLLYPTVGNILHYSLSILTKPLEISQWLLLSKKKHNIQVQAMSKAHAQNKHLRNVNSYSWVKGLIPTISAVPY